MLTHPVGHTGLCVPVLGFGAAPLGAPYYLANVDSNVQATAVVRHALARGISFFDTAPSYGSGMSEQRLGAALALPAHVPTKADLKGAADAAVDKGKAKADDKGDQAKAKADKKASDAKAKADAKAGAVPVAGEHVKAATAKGEGAAKSGSDKAKGKSKAGTAKGATKAKALTEKAAK